MSWLKYNFKDVILLVVEGHKGQLYGEHKYTYHLGKVEDKVRWLFKDEDLPTLCKLAELSWCHDILEDNEDYFFEHVREHIPDEMFEAIHSISKLDGETRIEYLERCMENPYAHKVKIADTLSNLEQSVKDGDFRRIKKYTRQLEKLTK